MNPSCARCKKTVYPVEKLNVLDQAWHKGCFTCEVRGECAAPQRIVRGGFSLQSDLYPRQVCNCVLTMKTYVALNKKPYCKTCVSATAAAGAAGAPATLTRRPAVPHRVRVYRHNPTVKFTAVADTPESRRLAEQQKFQSNVQYHADAEKLKGTVRAVATTPEIDRAKQNTAVSSNVKYHQAAQESSAHAPAGEESEQAPISAGAPAASEPGPRPEGASAEQPQTVSERYIADFDYVAKDTDEVSFNVGDTIVNVAILSEGWMQGTVESSGATGMFPSNYVHAG